MAEAGVQCDTDCMALEIVLLIVLVFVAAGVGTLTGFGTSTIMVPALSLFLPLPMVLLFVGIIHWFGNIWKMLFFKSGVRWRLLILFGASGLIASYLGASLILTISEDVLSRLLGIFLLAYVGWLWWRPDWKLPEKHITALGGGALSGFLAGIFGVGGAVRSAFLAAYNLPKDVFLFTSGAIGLVIDSTRLVTYWGEGVRLTERLGWALLFCIPASLLAAYVAKRIVDRILQKQFRVLVAAFLALVAIRLIVWPG